MIAGTLQCPSCGGQFTHHDRVFVYARAEDAMPAVHMVLMPGADPPEALPANPSARRSGLVVEGWCEACDDRWQLTVVQHKGETCVDVSVPQ